MAQRGKRGGRNTTRKPVTIDLEASADEALVEPSTDATSNGTDAANSAADAPKPAEPVAMENVSRDVSAEADADADAQARIEAGASEPVETPAPEPEQIEVPEAPAESAGPFAGTAGSTTIVHKRGVSAVGGGIIGGLLTLVGAAGLQSAGMLPNFGAEQAPVEQVTPVVDLTPLETQIAALQAELETVRSSSGESAGAVALPDDIQAQLAEAASVAADANARSEAAEAELASVNERLQDLQQAVSSGEAGEGAGLEAIASRLEALEAQESNDSTLSERLSALEQQSAETDEAGQASELDASVVIAAVQPSLDTINEQMGTLGNDVAAVSQTLEGVTGEIATIQQGLTSVTDQQAAAEEQLSGLSEQIAANAEQLEQSDAGNTVAKAIAASGLKSAADRGLPFMAELETFASTGGDPESMSALRDFAAAGVPTSAQLVEQFGSVANAIVASEQSLDESASITDRLMNSARSLVQVRDLDAVEGESVTAITNRMEAALKADDLDGALAQWETLPDSAKAASSAFADQLRARQNVDNLLDDVLTQAMAATAPSADQ